MKYVVIFEIPDTGYMDCIAVCDTAAEAYGQAYLELIDGLDGDAYYISLADNREGYNGYVMECVAKETGKVLQCATILFYRPEETEGVQSNDNP